MLKANGRGFIDFISEYYKGLKDAPKDTLYLLPNQWWEKAVDTSLPLTEIEQTFALLTVQRNEFIAVFVVWTLMSVLDDMAHGSPGMNPVLDMMKSDPLFASAWMKTLSLDTLSKPVTRCENCAKTPTMIGDNKKFMVCSSCKSKLNFTVHYCSTECQKQDWRNHKRHCGKQKVSKQLKGTVNDPFWKYPDVPDELRSLPLQNDKTVPITSIGFSAPDSSHPQSAAFQRQVSLLTGDKDADYFLFDEVDRPIRFAISDSLTKMAFRLMRSNALSTREGKGVEVIGEYLLKAMANHPGLNRKQILGQLGREYGEQAMGKIEAFEKLAVKNGYPPGTTFLEKMGSNLNSTLPMLHSRS